MAEKNKLPKAEFLCPENIVGFSKYEEEMLKQKAEGLTVRKNGEGYGVCVEKNAP